MANHIKIGKSGEALAVNHLKANNFCIMATNWRFKRVEIDIIAKDQNVWVFIEVKTRNTNQFGYPEEAVNHKKQQNILNAAANYLVENDLEVEIRFDVIAITIQPKVSIHHIVDAFYPGWD